MTSISVQAANELLAAGRIREASEMAKELLKSLETPNTRQIYARSYAARIRGLAQEGLFREARALGESIVTRHPFAKEALDPVLEELRLIENKFEKLLRELLGADEGEKPRLLAFLSANLADPRWLSESPVLPAGHPLKTEAEAVWKAFEAATSGSTREESSRLLDSIPRSSIFAPWKLAIRAIGALSQNDTETALKNASLIPESSRVHRFVPVIRALAGAGSPKLGHAGEQLTRSLASDREALGEMLHAIDQAIHKKQPDIDAIARPLQKIEASLPELPPSVRSVVLSTVIHFLTGHDLTREVIEKLLSSSKNRADVYRLTALSLDREDPFYSATLWNRYMEFCHARRIFAEKSLETALVLVHISEILPPEKEILEEINAGSAADLIRAIRSGTVPAVFDREFLLQRALKCHPTSDVYTRLRKLYFERDEIEKCIPLARDWKRDFPAVAEPWLILIQHARLEKNTAAALQLSLEATEHNPLDPKVRDYRFRAFLDSLEEGIRAKSSDCQDRLGAVQREPLAGSGGGKLYVSALEWALECRFGRGASAGPILRRLEKETGNELTAWVLAETAGHICGLKDRLPRARQGQLMEGLAESRKLLKEVGREPYWPREIHEWIEEEIPRMSSLDLLSLLSTPKRERPFTVRIENLAVLDGLKRKDGLLPAFLMARLLRVLEREPSAAGLFECGELLRAVEATLPNVPEDVPAAHEHLDTMREAVRAIEEIFPTEIMGIIRGKATRKEIDRLVKGHVTSLEKELFGKKTSPAAKRKKTPARKSPKKQTPEAP